MMMGPQRRWRRRPAGRQASEAAYQWLPPCHPQFPQAPHNGPESCRIVNGGTIQGHELVAGMKAGAPQGRRVIPDVQS